MNIAIVEDKEEDRSKLIHMLTQYKSSFGVSLHIDVYASGEEFLSTGIDRTYQLLLMDIYLAQLDGIETVSRFLSKREDILIVFLTSSDDDIWRAVQTHHCFDYIRKSDLDDARLEKLLSDVMSKLDIMEKRIEFQSGKHKISLIEQDIQYVISRDKYIVIGFKNTLERKFRYPFSQFYDLVVDTSCWLLCNRGVLLNMNYVQQSDGLVFIMKHDVQFPIRRKDRKQIIQAFEQYQFEQLDKQEIFL